MSAYLRLAATGWLAILALGPTTAAASPGRPRVPPAVSTTPAALATVAPAVSAAPLATVAPAVSAAPTAAPVRRRAPLARPLRPATPAPPSPMHLVLEAPATRGPWTIHVVNTGDVPAVITADARLVRLDVTPRGARKARTCELPREMRPEDDLERPLVVPPGREYDETFDPRLYCIDPTDFAALAPQSIVVAHLGWAGSAGAPPFEVAEVAPVDKGKTEVSPVKSLDAEPIALPDELTPAPTRARPSPDGTALVLSSPKTRDAESPSTVVIPVTLRNDGARATVVRFRPEMLGFEVLGPTGARRCSWPTLPAAPTRELFTTLPPNGTVTLTLELSDYCPPETFGQPGLLTIRPRLDTRGASGVRIGVRAFDGVVVAAGTSVVRLRRGLEMTPLTRPQLRPSP